MTQSERPARGRPPRPETRKPKSGKGSSVRALVTQELRDALDAEAAKTGRSLSQVAELWLEEACRGHASAEAILGGEDTLPALKQMARVASQISSLSGPPSESFASRQAILAAWMELAESLVPAPIDVKGSQLLGGVLEEMKRLADLGWTDLTEVNSRVWREYEGRFGGLHDKANDHLPLGVTAADVISRLYEKTNPELLNALADYYFAEKALADHTDQRIAENKRHRDKIKQFLNEQRLSVIP